jgi:hypothetical protein
MNTIQLRFALFFFGCMGSRFFFTWLSSWVHPSSLPWLGSLALLPALGWFYLTFLGDRDTGSEVFGELIWWKQLRPLHMLLWGFFAYLAFQQNPHAWIVLLVDTLIGLSFFLHHHWIEGNFSKLLK